MDENLEKDSIKEHILSKAELTEYLRKRALHHNHYRVYGKVNRILSIRDEKTLYLGCGKNWNDIQDRNCLNNDKLITVNFCRCFSFSTEESVAMWMLYGGLDKKGGMIDFTQKGIKSLLESSRIELGTFDNEAFISKTTLSSGFKIFVTDVLYYKEYENCYYVKRSDESERIYNKGIVNSLDFCTKTFPWQYENECRLIVSVQRELVPDECTDVKIDFSNLDMGKSLDRIYYHPCFPEEAKKNNNIRKSQLEKKVEWDLR